LTRIVRLPRRFSPADLDLAVDLGHDRRILRLAGLEDLGDAGQTAGDVLRAAGFTRRLGQHVPGSHLSRHFDLDVGLLGQVVEVEDLAVDSSSSTTCGW
jgi:hypothetical protein